MPGELKPDDDQSQSNDKPVGESEETGSSGVSEQSLAAIEGGTADTEPIQRTSSTVSDETRPWLREEEKPSKKGKIIGIIAAVLAIVLVGSSYAAYALWYQNPEKVVMDSMLSAVLAKTSKTSGDMTLTYNDYVIKVDFTGEGGADEGTSGSATLTVKNKKQNIDIALKGQGVVASKGDVYLKVDDLEKVYNGILDAIIDSQVDTLKQQGQSVAEDQTKQLRQAYDSLFGSVITKIGDKWIKISADDVKTFDKKLSDEYTCIQEVSKKIKDDKKLIDQVSDVYMQHRFLIIKDNLGVRDGSVGYAVDIDKQIGKEFDKAVQDTTLYKDLAGCSDGAAQYLKSTGESGSKVDEDTSSDPTYEIEVWANQWSHQLTKLKVGISSDKSSDKMALDLNMNPQINVPVTVATPKSVISLKDLMTLFGEAMGEDTNNTAASDQA